MDDSIVVKELKSFVKRHGSQKEAARVLGISTQYLNDLLRSRRNVSEEIAGRLGYKAEWVKDGVCPTCNGQGKFIAVDGTRWKCVTCKGTGYKK